MTVTPGAAEAGCLAMRPILGEMCAGCRDGHPAMMRGMSQEYPPSMRRWTVRGSEYVVRQPPWFVLRRDHVVLPDGHDLGSYYVVEQKEWANVVAVTADDQVVMVRQYRHGLGESHLEIPGGFADGEPLAGARRELVEETEDLEVELHPLAGVRALIKQGAIVHALHIAPLLAALLELEPQAV
jgi:NUDIX domain